MSRGAEGRPLPLKALPVVATLHYHPPAVSSSRRVKVQPCNVLRRRWQQGPSAGGRSVKAPLEGILAHSSTLARVHTLYPTTQDLPINCVVPIYTAGWTTALGTVAWINKCAPVFQLPRREIDPITCGLQVPSVRLLHRWQHPRTSRCLCVLCT